MNAGDRSLRRQARLRAVLVAVAVAAACQQGRSTDAPQATPLLAVPAVAAPANPTAGPPLGPALAIGGTTVNPSQPSSPTSATRETDAVRKVRRAAYAGSWYPAEPGRLQTELDGYLTAVLPAVQAKPAIALIAPHAGYRFSGPVAAYSYRQLQGRSDIRRVVMLGPSHRYGIAKVAFTDASHVETPLGRIAIDRPFLQALQKDSLFVELPAADAREHSLEMQWPFLQRVLAGSIDQVKLVPLVVGQLDAVSIRNAARAILPLLDAQTIVVISSDFTHYGPNYDYVPFTDDVQENLHKLDMKAFAAIQARDIDGLLALRRDQDLTVCGILPISILLALLPDDAEATLLKYDTSGRMMNDNENSVSYLAIAFSGRPWSAAQNGPSVTEPAPGTPPERATVTAGASGPAAARYPVSTEERKTLLKLARDAIVMKLTQGRSLTPADIEAGYPLTSRMREPSGAFVTLKKHGALRGCIGEIPPRRPLFQVVADHAVDAAIHDTRFPPVTSAELAALHIEISVLTPPEPVASYRDIALGRHGIYLINGGWRAVFLPQVAPEQGWDLVTTLAHLSVKAGLPPDSWQDPRTRFEVFEAVVFEEPRPDA